MFHQFGYTHPLDDTDLQPQVCYEWGGVMNSYAMKFEPWSVLPFSGKALRKLEATAEPQNAERKFPSP